MHKFDPANAARLERAERYTLIPPKEALLKLGLKPGMTFVDIGAGTGFFSRPASAIVGETGRVFAADLAPGMLEFMRGQGLPPNLTPLLSTEYAVPVSDGIADMTFMAFVTHETPDLLRFLNEAARITRPGGRIAIVDWKKQQEEQGPPEAERIAESDFIARVSPHHTIIEHGAMNASHYYVILQPGKP